MNTVNISNKSRNLGYGWNNHPTQQYVNGRSVLAILSPTEPSTVGSVRKIQREHWRVAEINKANDWVSSLFVDGRRVTGVWQDDVPVYDLHDDAVLPEPQRYESGWYSMAVSGVIQLLASGNVLKVRLEEGGD